MTDLALFQILRGWLVTAVPTINVIRSHQGAPAPAGAYLAVEAIGSWTPIGQTSKVLTDPTYVAPRAYDYIAKVALWGVRDGGIDAIRTAVEWLETQTALDYFAPTGVTILKAGEITAIPALDDSRWVPEVRCQLDLLITVGNSGSGNYIETVEFNNQITGGS